MASPTTTHITGTARASCKGAGGRFETRTIDVDIEVEGALTESEAMGAGSADAIARIGRQCYSFSWLSFSYSISTVAVGGEIGVRAHVYFKCYGSGEDETMQLEYADNWPATVTRDEVERAISDWGLEQQYKAESGFGSGKLVAGCVYIRHEIISPLYWPMSGGI